MVTLITEKLQNQSLDDLTHKSYDAGPCSAENVSSTGCLFPFETNKDKHPWKVVSRGPPVGSQAAAGPTVPFSPSSLGAVSARDLREPGGPPSAPPTKRHCRSLSEPDELARCRSPWRPGGSRVWTPVSKRRCHSGGSATLQGSPSAGPSRSAWSPGHALPAAGPTSPPAPRPASASSGFLDLGDGSLGPAWRPAGPWALPARRRLSLSQEHLVAAGAAPPSAGSSPTSTPQLGRRRGLLRCRSQPCVRAGGKSRLKRRREEDRWPRPSLDFLKMTRTLKNSKSLCSLDYEDEDEDDARVKTAVSSPRDPHGLQPRPAGLSPRASPEWVAAEGEGWSGGDPSDWDSAGEEGAFPLDRSRELDLEQIENN
ncbi:protein FAM53A [Camelus dromedarius]|uniref:Protein FAM53A n=7 Tax=Camelus TaxID=9836 RepID=A0A8B8U241_CAMFR|nr:protein FAM53A [Camelus ferus]XP_032348192.1 protein FAM53A [Camelus ferus]XP_032348200.1 protein FAM53A [Camelus ferus]XP_032348203.1 protein FAM53A [Camelus ferus]XP_032348207.1 protein FAM53A [Camelus ferus]XP_032348215.1 protein FAM53A [Camelus ferus]